MGIFGDTAGKSWIGWRRLRAWITIPRGVALLAALELACVLGGCAANDSGQLLIDPGRYDIYKCDDLAKRWKVVAAREKELRELLARAGQSSGGAVVGAIAYRADYDAVLSDERLLQRTAAEKNCALPFQGQSVPFQPGQAAGPPQNSQYQSDQSIR